MRIEIIDGIKYRLDEDKLTAEVSQMMGYKGDIIIPETVVFNEATYRVTSIGYEAFKGCSSLTSITIPNSVKSIGEAAFKGCTFLKSIPIPDGVTRIGVQAFFQCRSLKSITIPASVKSIGHGAFDMCESLKSIIFQGTIAQWKEIELGSSFPTAVVHCTDGDWVK